VCILHARVGEDGGCRWLPVGAAGCAEEDAGVHVGFGTVGSFLRAAPAGGTELAVSCGGARAAAAHDVVAVLAGGAEGREGRRQTLEEGGGGSAAEGVPVLTVGGGAAPAVRKTADSGWRKVGRCLGLREEDVGGGSRRSVHSSVSGGVEAAAAQSSW
jgi:hypothetical protein